MILQGSSPPPKGGKPTSGVLISPNFPGSYPSNLNLVQKVQVPEGNTIWIRFTELDCELSTVTVTDTGKLLAKMEFNSILLNGTYSEDWTRQIVSDSNAVEVRFRTYSSAEDRGWRLEWGESEVILIANQCFGQEWSETRRACQRVEF